MQGGGGKGGCFGPLGGAGNQPNRPQQRLVAQTKKKLEMNGKIGKGYKLRCGQEGAEWGTGVR